MSRLNKKRQFGVSPILLMGCAWAGCPCTAILFVFRSAIITYPHTFFPAFGSPAPTAGFDAGLAHFEPAPPFYTIRIFAQADCATWHTTRPPVAVWWLALVAVGFL
jgi:hypothetical protein